MLRSFRFCCEEGYYFRDDVGGGEYRSHSGMLRHTVYPFSLTDRQTDIQTRDHCRSSFWQQRFSVVFWITPCDIVGSGEIFFLLGFSPFCVLSNQNGDNILHVRTRSPQIVQEMDAEFHLGSVESHLNVLRV